MTLNIALTGAGNSIASFKLDGQVTALPQVPGTLTGMHQVDITLGNALPNLARDAVATSSATPADYPGAAGVNDGKINGYLDNASPSPDFKAGSAASGLNLGDERKSEWVSATKTAGWVQLDWPTAQSVQVVRLFDRINASDQVTGGTLSFSDGSTVPVGSLPNDGLSALEARFAAKAVKWVRFTIDSSSASTLSPGLAELEVLGVQSGGPSGGSAGSGGMAGAQAGAGTGGSVAVGTGGASGGTASYMDNAGGAMGSTGGASGSVALGGSDAAGGATAPNAPAAGTTSGCGCTLPGSSLFTSRAPGGLALLAVGSLLGMTRRRGRRAVASTTCPLERRPCEVAPHRATVRAVVAMLKCPNCGAPLQASGMAEQRACAYCGALLQVPKPTPAMHAPRAQPATQAQSSRAILVVAIFGMLSLTALAAGAGDFPQR